jgi:hypothetical protein
VSAYDSTKKANQAFDDRLAQAVRVIDHAPKINKDNMGQRAVAVFFDADANQYYASVFWTDCQFIGSIHSTSYLHAIEFEKQYFR